MGTKGNRLDRRLLGFVALTLALLVAAPGWALAASPQRTEQLRVRGAHPGLADVLAATRGSRRIQVAVQLRGRPVSARIGEGIATGRPMSTSGITIARRTVAARQRRTATQLRGLGARVEARYTDVFNGFRITVRADRVRRISRLPNVAGVLTVTRHMPDNARTDGYLGVPATWGDAGKTGKGVRIAIIDSGINYYHQDFGGAGSAAWEADDPTVREPGTFPTAKVVGGTDLVGDAYDGDTNAIPHPDPDPLDCKARAAETVQHGTHVAGTAAGMGVTAGGEAYTGPYDAHTLSHQKFRIAPGVAPQAKLMAYRVFGCSGGTFLVTDAIERAVQAGADVINMSLGSSFGDPGSLDSIAADNASLAGVTVVVSSGNEGSSAYITGTPAVATRAISVAAMDALSSFPAATIHKPTGNDVTAIVANGVSPTAQGRLNVFRDDPNTSVDPDTGAGDESLGCHAADYAYNGFQPRDIVAVVRGICARSDRATQGQRQGAAAVIMINDGSDFPPFEGPIRGVSIPFLGVRAGATGGLHADDGRTIRIAARSEIPNPEYRALANFSSWGPSSGDSGLKPDVTAPGVSVISADGGTTWGAKGLSGTSMAAPAVTGVAALIKQAHPTWSPRDIKAAIVGTASPTRVSPFDMRGAGAGLAQPRRAVDTTGLVYTDGGASSLSFGSRTAFRRSGTPNAFSATLSFTIRNRSSHAIRYDLRNAFNGGSRHLRVSISPGSVNVPARGTRTVHVTIVLRETDVAALPASAPDHAPTVDSDAAGALFTTLTTIKGAIIATPRSSGKGVYTLRVPWMVVPRGISDVHPVDSTRSGWQVDGALRRASIRIDNGALHKGIVDVYAWGLSDGRDTPGDVDLRAAGVQSLPTEVCTGTPDPSDRCLLFAINTWGHWSNAAADEWVVSVDVNKDGTEDLIILGVDDGLVFDGEENGVLDALVIDSATDELIDGFLAVAPANGSTLLLPALASDLGLSSGGTRAFDYLVTADTLAGDLPAQDTMNNLANSGGQFERARYDAFTPVIRNGFFQALAGSGHVSLPLVVDHDRIIPDRGMRGWLVVTLDDANGPAQADMVPVGALP
jgi:subtilisin family serine protease